jgi:polyisoprenoid-binding protein YceI
MKLTNIISGAILALMSTTTLATEFHFDQQNSQLNFQGSYDGEPIDGKFARFSGTLAIDLSKPSGARFNVQIQVASLDSEYGERDDMLKSAEWFDAAKFPNATFVSSGDCVLASAAAGLIAKLNCPGILQIRDRSKAVTLAVEVDSQKQSLIGKSSLNRRDFGIGQGEWDESGVIGETVSVSFQLALKAK